MASSPSQIVGATAPREITKLETLTSRAYSEWGDAGGLCNQLEDVLVRLRGSIPQPASIGGGKVAEKPVREPPVLEALEESVAGITDAHSRMRNLLNELAVLV